MSQEKRVSKRIIFISATCKENELTAPFASEILVSVGDKINPEMFFFGIGKVPEEILAMEPDLIVIDPVVTWGGNNKTLLPQLRRQVEARQSNLEIQVLPRKKADREVFFKEPKTFASALILQYAVAAEPESEEDTEPAKETIVPMIIPVFDADAIVKVLINMPLFSEKIAEDVKVMIEEAFPGQTLSVISVHGLSFKGYRNFDVLVTSVQRGFIPSLSHVERARRSNPDLETVLLGKKVTTFIDRHRELISEFVEFPPEERSLTIILGKVFERVSGRKEGKITSPLKPVEVRG